MKSWVVFGIASAFVGIGAGAILAPKRSSRGYGLPADDPTALALVRAVGARDLIFGAIFLAMRDDDVALARIAAWTSLAGVADAAFVASVRGLQPIHVVHVGGAIALALAARR
jgi:hypothetical protein